MKNTPMKLLTLALKGTAILLALLVTISCQQQGPEHENTTPEVSNETPATLTSEKRPAPEFFVIDNKELASKRVWILEDSQSDIFHLKHDCPLLISGKGKGTFKNVTVARAIEDFGRYNCQECSKELDHIFDENAIRAETGFGDNR
jgi:hypothetical protein